MLSPGKDTNGFPYILIVLLTLNYLVEGSFSGRDMSVKSIQKLLFTSKTFCFEYLKLKVPLCFSLKKCNMSQWMNFNQIGGNATITKTIFQ